MSETTNPTAKPTPTLLSRMLAEAVGTLILVFGGVGTAIFAAGFKAGVGGFNVGFLGVALAFGLTVVVGAYSLGPISGGHFNTAVTLGLAAAGRFPWRDVLGYVIAQLIGAVIGSSLLFWIASGGPTGFLAKTVASGFGSNGYGAHSPGGFGLGSAILIEIILTAVFLYVIIGVTSQGAAPGFAALAIGLTLTLIHLISIPVDNTSVNPARSIAAAIYGGPGNLAQLWVFILFPIVGGFLAGFTFKPLFGGLIKQAAA
ncbi:aquaporin Z [Planctomonas sp. JC2975]|uniref:aquaporin Z n=1 Tax=Planctomonas sp. JC2975 TaxID=2729626 RepID=UPI0014733B19|nr:aquaporin Z [Planctomonas sp. JC2975]NNC13103.1 aquaporin Z [Planctomonas sp. JC2975]